MKAPFFCEEIDVLKIKLSETFEKKLWKTSIFRRVAGYKKFFKGFNAFNEILNSLRQVLQTYSEICIFCVLKKAFQKQSVNIDLKVPGKSCDEIDDNAMKFIL